MDPATQAVILRAAMDPKVQKLAKQFATVGVKGAVQAGQAIAQGVRQARRPKQVRPRNRGPREGAVFRQPVAQSRRIGPSYSRNGNGRVSSGREFLGNVTGTSGSTPTVTTYELNPGLVATFPRLSKEAEVWEEYRFRRLRVEYTPAVATSTAGTVVLAPEYNASSAAPTTEAGLLNHQGAKSGNPWAPLSIDLDPSAMHGNAARKFVREDPVAGDRNNYDVGKLLVATLSNGGTGTMGKLWLVYECEFFVPQVEPLVPNTNLVLSFNRSADQTIPKTVVTAIAWDETIQNSFGVTLDDSVVLPKGAWLVFFECTVRDSAAEAFSGVSELLYGGASLPIPRVTGFHGVSLAGQTNYLSICGYVETNGTSGLQCILALAGAAGTLQALGNYTRLTCLCVSA